MPATFSIEHEGRLIEVVPDSLWERDRVRLLVNGQTIVERKADGKRTMLEGDGVKVHAVMPFWGGSVSRADLVREDGARIRLEPEPGTRAARVRRFEEAHPRVFAARHVLSGIAQVAIAIIGITFAFRLLPAIPLPDINLPNIDLPSIPLPSIDLPSITVPDWVKWMLKTKQYWLPIVIGIVLASAELKRRRDAKMDRHGARHTARPGAGTPAGSE
jgi:hypothetical protein